MPLQVWLPFLGNTDNHGLTELPKISVSNLAYTNGKLGICAYGHIGWHLNSDILDNTWTFATWYKASYFGQYNNIIFCKNIQSSEDCQIYISIISNNRFNIGVNGPSSSYGFGYAFSTDTWYHLAATYDGTTVSLYINGELVHYGTVTTAKPEGRLNIQIDGRSNNAGGTGSTGSTDACYNDVRLYNECLSPKEIKILSQGLVCHYQLSDPYSTSNLIPNGFGQDGGLGWTSSSNISTTEIPPNQPAIKASYHSGNMTTSYIPISHDTTYTINMYLKAMSGATGTTYPAIYPYDIDKKFIDYYKCTIGFGTAYKTTLAQPLHKGDTVIYATNLSAWTTATDNYYYHVAIFGYADSTGYVYPDMGYTADSPSFGSRTDKSNIDKTNNTITLLSPFTGEDRPAGTTICQATEGSTYFYPYGGINVSTLTDWTYKTASIDVNNTRLRFAKYINFMSYYSVYCAGIQLIDNNANRIVYDSSGYNYHGKVDGSLLVSSDTPRNSISTYFATDEESVTIPAWWAKYTEVDKMSSSIWFKTNTLNNTAPNLWSLGENYFVRIRLASTTSIWYYMQGTYGSYTTKTLTDNTWHHVVFVFNSGVVTMYLDGAQIGTTDHSATKPTMTVNSINWHLAGYTASLEKFIGYLSDFRIYATALTAEDVQILYNAPVSVANNGAMITQGEFVEV